MKNNEKIPDINLRIRQVIDIYANKSVTKFAKSVNISQQTLNRLFVIDKRTGKYPLATTDIIKKISELYDINATWILTGNGEMLEKSSQTNTQTITGDFNFQTNKSNDINNQNINSELINLLKDQIREKDKIISEKEQQIITKDEQIKMLLSILTKNQKV